jgi:peroxin-19
MNDTFENLMAGVFNNEEGGDDEEKMVGVLEKIMEALMAPDILQKPMEELREKYPIWLANNEGKVSQEEYDRVMTQYQYTQKICKLYEQQKFPDSLGELIELMKGMQAYGQPPEEIVQSLSQDGSQGLPNIPGLGLGDGLDPKNCPVQ